MGKVKRGTRYVDVANPALAVDCPRCGLQTARFTEYCRNCGYSIWPSGEMATAAFRTWRDHDASRAAARRYDLEVPAGSGQLEIDYVARAHALGIHLFPSSNYPFLICVGFLFLAFAAMPFASGVRIGSLIVGLLIFFWGVVGWVIIEDVRMFPTSAPPGDHSHGHH